MPISRWMDKEAVVHIHHGILLLAILWNSAFKWVYLSFSPLPLASLLFSAICKSSSDNHFPFLHFFFLQMVLITASCTASQTSVHSSSGTLSIWSNPWIYFSLPLYHHKGLGLSHTWMVSRFSLFSILYTVVCIYQSQSPNLSYPYPL